MDISILCIPNDPLLHLFSYLDYRDLVSCCLVCKRFREIVRHDLLWKKHCEKYWLLEQFSADQCWYSSFVKYYGNYGRYISCYAKIKKAWNQIEEYTKEHFPNIYDTLRDGISEEDIDRLKLPTPCTKLPEDLRCAYRIHDGQNVQEFRPTPGLFGTMEIHGHIKSEIMLDLKSALEYAEEEVNSSMSSCIPITTSEMSSLYIALASNDGHQEGQVIYVTVDQEKCSSTNKYNQSEWIFDDFIIGSSFTEWFTHYAQTLAAGQFPKISDQIYRFQGDPKCVAKTGPITVKVATCFMPEFSTVHPPRYFFTYRIKMSMDPHALDRESCQLESRYWIITDESGKKETVNGLGVVGEFPIMKPGEDYSWISCTSFNTPYGNMRGHFTMKNLQTGAKSEVKCPTYHMRSPPVQTSSERDMRRLQAPVQCDN